MEEHRHCKVCSKVCDASRETCSRTCEEDLRRRRESRQGYNYLFYVLMAILAVVLIVEVVHP